MSPTTYHLWLQDEAKGPFTLNQVRSMWSGGQLTGENLYSTDAGQEWRYLKDILDELEPAPVPIPKIVQSDEKVVRVLEEISKSQAATQSNTGFVVAVIILAMILIGGGIAWLVIGNEIRASNEATLQDVTNKLVYKPQ